MTAFSLGQYHALRGEQFNPADKNLRDAYNYAQGYLSAGECEQASKLINEIEAMQDEEREIGQERWQTN